MIHFSRVFSRAIIVGGFVYEELSLCLNATNQLGQFAPRITGTCCKYLRERRKDSRVAGRWKCLTTLVRGIEKLILCGEVSLS